MKRILTIFTIVMVSLLGTVRFKTEAMVLTQERKEIKLDPKIYAAYIGEYSIELSPEKVVKIGITREGDKLMGQAADKPKIQLFPETETKFFAKVADLQVTFAVEKDGKVSHLTLVDSGKTLEAKKTK